MNSQLCEEKKIQIARYKLVIVGNTDRTVCYEIIGRYWEEYIANCKNCKMLPQNGKL